MFVGVVFHSYIHRNIFMNLAISMLSRECEALAADSLVKSSPRALRSLPRPPVGDHYHQHNHLLSRIQMQEVVAPVLSSFPLN